MADNFLCTGEERGKRPEAQQSRRGGIEDDFPLMTLYAAILCPAGIECMEYVIHQDSLAGRSLPMSASCSRKRF